MKTITVLNWQNRRATQPMAAAVETFTQTHKDCEIHQVIRPLSDFEHQDIEVIAKRHDLIVYDHPFSGRIAESGCFMPLDPHLPDLLGPESGPRYIGPSLASYRYEGHVWGAPIDGATQNAIYRQDLLDRLGAAVPQSHAHVLALGQKARQAGLYLGTAIETPHALMSIFSYMANLGQPIVADAHGIQDIPAGSFTQAYESLARLLTLCAPEAAHWNSIDLHEAMVARDDIVYSPAVYGYATYGESDQRVPLAFADFAGLQAPYAAGSTIGGTALGLSRHSPHTELALAFIAHMISESVQTTLVGAHFGQPATLGGWENTANDQRFNGFYSAVHASMEQSWVRPRFSGFVAFQREGGLAMAQALRQHDTADAARRTLMGLAQAHRA